jgi:enoyl-CoA hydratase
LPPVLVEREGPLMILTLNRPRRLNAFTGAMLAIIADACAAADADDEVRCIILTGADGNFSAGADLRAMAGDTDDDGAAETRERYETDPSYVERGFLKTGRPMKPIIAAVEGVAIAGGTEILLGTDIRVAGESARFGVSEARWSLYPLMGSAVRLPRQTSYTKAAEILLTGKHISAREAEQIGLVGHVVPDGTALEKAKEIAAQICANGPIAVREILRTIRETAGLTEAEGFAHESDRARAVFESEDSKEGPRAFAEKRAPVYQGR